MALFNAADSKGPDGFVQIVKQRKFSPRRHAADEFDLEFLHLGTGIGILGAHALSLAQWIGHHRARTFTSPLRLVIVSCQPEGEKSGLRARMHFRGPAALLPGNKQGKLSPNLARGRNPQPSDRFCQAGLARCRDEAAFPVAQEIGP